MKKNIPKQKLHIIYEQCENRYEEKLPEIIHIVCNTLRMWVMENKRNWEEKIRSFWNLGLPNDAKDYIEL